MDHATQRVAFEASFRPCNMQRCIPSQRSSTSSERPSSDRACVNLEACKGSPLTPTRRWSIVKRDVAPFAQTSKGMWPLIEQLQTMSVFCTFRTLFPGLDRLGRRERTVPVEVVGVSHGRPSGCAGCPLQSLEKENDTHRRSGNVENVNTRSRCGEVSNYIVPWTIWWRNAGGAKGKKEGNGMEEVSEPLCDIGRLATR